MSDRRRAEIEAKRAKLAELKKAKELRRQQELERRASGSPVSSSPCSGTRIYVSHYTQAAGASAAQRDVDDLVSTLIGPSPRTLDTAVSPTSSIPGTPFLQSSTPLPGPSSLYQTQSGRASRQSDETSDRLSFGTTMVTSNGGTDHVMERYTSPHARNTHGSRFQRDDTTDDTRFNRHGTGTL